MVLHCGVKILLIFDSVVGLDLRVAFLVPVVPMISDSLKFGDPRVRIADKVGFTKNVALLGAVLKTPAMPSPRSSRVIT